MAIAFRAVGTTKKVASGNLASVALPAGHVANDILILFTSQNDNVVCSVDQSFVNILAVNNGTRDRIEVWAKRDGGAETAPTVTHASGGRSNAILAAFSGVDTGLTIGTGSGKIFVDAQSQNGTDATNYTGPALTGVVSGDMLIFYGGFTVVDTSGATTNNWGTVSGWTEDKDDCSALTGTAAVSFGIDHLIATGSAGSITSAVGWTGSTGSGSPTFWTWIGNQLALSSAVSGGAPAAVVVPKRVLLGVGT